MEPILEVDVLRKCLSWDHNQTLNIVLTASVRSHISVAARFHLLPLSLRPHCLRPYSALSPPASTAITLFTPSHKSLHRLQWVTTRTHRPIIPPSCRSSRLSCWTAALFLISFYFMLTLSWRFYSALQCPWVSWTVLMNKVGFIHR